MKRYIFNLLKSIIGSAGHLGVCIKMYKIANLFQRLAKHLKQPEILKGNVHVIINICQNARDEHSVYQSSSASSGYIMMAPIELITIHKQFGIHGFMSVLYRKSSRMDLLTIFNIYLLFRVYYRFSTYIGTSFPATSCFQMPNHIFCPQECFKYTNIFHIQSRFDKSALKPNFTRYLSI